MHSYNKDIGSFGEALARDYLISKGYKIKKYYNFNVRYDIIEVIFNTITSSHIINHVQDAFRAY